MKITPKVTVVQEYTVELSREQLEHLGRLSYQFEGGDGKRFHELLPADVRAGIGGLGSKLIYDAVEHGVWEEKD